MVEPTHLKNMLVKLGIFSKVRVNIKHIWNHQLDENLWFSNKNIFASVSSIGSSLLSMSGAVSPNPPCQKSRLTLPETNSSPLKMDGWNTTFLLGRPIFRGYVSFREGILYKLFVSRVGPVNYHRTHSRVDQPDGLPQSFHQLSCLQT